MGLLNKIGLTTTPSTAKSLIKEHVQNDTLFGVEYDKYKFALHTVNETKLTDSGFHSFQEILIKNYAESLIKYTVNIVNEDMKEYYTENFYSGKKAIKEYSEDDYLKLSAIEFYNSINDDIIQKLGEQPKTHVIHVLDKLKTIIKTHNDVMFKDKNGNESNIAEKMADNCQKIIDKLKIPNIESQPPDDIGEYTNYGNQLKDKEEKKQNSEKKKIEKFNDEHTFRPVRETIKMIEYVDANDWKKKQKEASPDDDDDDNIQLKQPYSKINLENSLEIGNKYVIVHKNNIENSKLKIEGKLEDKLETVKITNKFIDKSKNGNVSNVRYVYILNGRESNRNGENFEEFYVAEKKRNKILGLFGGKRKTRKANKRKRRSRKRSKRNRRK